MRVEHMQETDRPTLVNNLPHVPLTVKSIFKYNRNWDKYFYYHRKELRDVEVREISKMLLCKEEDNGWFAYYCIKCQKYRVITLGCNGRLCSHCGKRYTDKWSKELSKNMLKVPHRHFVLSVPPLLWDTLLDDRSLWKVLMDSAIVTINNVLSHATRQRVKAGAVVVLHPFGKTLQFKPHIHVLLTEGGFSRKDKFVHKSFFPAKSMRKVWQYQVLTNLKSALSCFSFPSRIVNRLFREYPDGFYVWLPEQSKIKNKKEVSSYVGRYVRHPAIADYRISGYNGIDVEFLYEDKDKKRHYVRMSVDEFIKSIIQHIPEHQFKMIRYYGAYWRRGVRKYRRLTGLICLVQRKLSDYVKHRSFKCPKCGSLMEFVEYAGKGPPETGVYGEKIEDWNVLGVV